MYVEHIGKLLGEVRRFCDGECGYLGIAQILEEPGETIETLFLLSRVMDVQGRCREGVTESEVLAVITLMYVLRANRKLRVRTFDSRFKKH